jgi:hypothetical protein
VIEDDQPTYIAVCRATRQMAIVNLPPRLQPYANNLAEHLATEYYGQPIDDNLIYCLNWTARQWIIKSMDDMNFEEQP